MHKVDRKRRIVANPDCGEDASGRGNFPVVRKDAVLAVEVVETEMGNVEEWHEWQCGSQRPSAGGLRDRPLQTCGALRSIHANLRLVSQPPLS